MHCIKEPHNLKRWATALGYGDVYTCGRPGRSQGRDNKRICDWLVSQWVEGLPQARQITIISLLGRKHSGLSEFSYYSFCGGFDTDAERNGQPTFQEWLQQHHRERNIRVCEFPTVDTMPVPEETLTSVAKAICHSMAAGETVIVVDSAGCERTGKVRCYMKLTAVLD